MPGAPELPLAEPMELLDGEPTPLGATLTDEGVNFAVYASQADAVELCLFDSQGEREIMRLKLPARTQNVWHGLLPAPMGAPGIVYGYRVYGPYDPDRGLRHHPSKLLIDPYARAVAGRFTWHDALHVEHMDSNALDERDSAPYNLKGRVIDSMFDWSGDIAPAIPWRDTIIYELHVKGFTYLHPEVPEALRGKYLGLAHPAVIDYLRRLGITAVELLPVQEFISERFLIEKSLTNYWGYNPINWFAPAQKYAIHDPVTEFKTMVKALHAAGIEVILDVVFNHTAEGNEFGPTLSWRGFDNTAYYKLEPDNLRHYQNRTGVGNTIAASEPAARQLIVDCLRYWVEEMHVDGFRFDLAAVLGRDDSRFQRDSRFFQAIAAEPALRYTKLIAEPWDVGYDGYQLGRFPPSWSEWNDLYRDTMRAFWRGNPGIVGNFAERFAGSSDLFRASGRRPTASVNYVACHDGFTLYDTAAYNEKHNEANLEDNRDGHNHNLSYNYGIEGETDDPRIQSLRLRHVRNLLATLLLSQGVPMLQAGDEFARTQRGNNNAYCQDNELSWVDWRCAQKHSELIDFVRQLIDLRKQAPGLRRDTFLKGARQVDREHKDVSWRHPEGHELMASDWHDSEARAIGVLFGHAFTDTRDKSSGNLFLLCNSGDLAVNFKLPPTHAEEAWRVVFDTAHLHSTNTPMLATGEYCIVAARSCVLLADGDVPSALAPPAAGSESA
jgi:glycogen operon protein